MKVETPAIRRNNYSLIPDQRAAIMMAVNAGETYRVIAARFNTSTSTISDIKRR